MDKQENRLEKNQIHPALLLIDVQNQYMQYMAEKNSMLTFDTINWAIALFRQCDYPVISIYHTDPKMGPSPDSDAFKFDPAFQVESDDPKFIKNYPNAFKKTDLDKFLREKGCNTLFLCGLSAVGCVLATYYSAFDLEYNVFMLKNGIMSHDSSFTKFVEDAMESVSIYTLNFILMSRQF